jgi:hypothetical protein
VSCRGPTIGLLSAIPADGYTLEVHNPGPTIVSVEFNKGLHSWSVHAACRSGQPVGFIDA